MLLYGYLILSVGQDSWMECLIRSRCIPYCRCAQLPSCTVQYFSQCVLPCDRFLRAHDILDHKGFLESKGQENGHCQWNAPKYPIFKVLRLGWVRLLTVSDLSLKPSAEYQWSLKGQMARETELKWRVKENIVDTVISFVWLSSFWFTLSTAAFSTAAYYRTWLPSATALTSFTCYTLISGQPLTVSKAFTSIALFSQLQHPMVQLPGQFFAMLHGTSLMYSVGLYLTAHVCFI